MRGIGAALMLFVAVSTIAAQPLANVTLHGYIRETPIYWKPYVTEESERSCRLENLLHTWQNVRWFPTHSTRMGLELKTRFFTGKSARELSTQTDFFARTQPYFHWTRTFIDEKHAVLNSTIDRAWMQWTLGQLQAMLGRQRVAWGTNLVWNPTDVFNPASPLDFDNEEKSGVDAARMQLYLGPNSVLDAAVVPQREVDHTTAAVRLKLNRWEYDWHVLAGRRGSEAIAGFAWAGNIVGGGFRGEILYAKPRASANVQSLNITAAVSGDYTFRSSLYVHTEILYNKHGSTGMAGGQEYLTSLARGDLSPARLSLFGEVACDLSPLVRAGTMGILNPNDHSWYFGPTLSWSVATNLDFIAAALLFGGKAATEFGDNGNMLMLRLKYSF